MDVYMQPATARALLLLEVVGLAYEAQCGIWLSQVCCEDHSWASLQSSYGDLSLRSCTMPELVATHQRSTGWVQDVDVRCKRPALRLLCTTCVHVVR